MAQDVKNPAQQMAGASLVAIFCAIALSWAGIGLARSAGTSAGAQEGVHLASRIIGVIALSLYLASPVLAIVSLSKMGKYGKRGVIVFAISSLVISLLGFGATAIAWNAGRVARQVREARDEMSARVDVLSDALEKRVKEALAAGGTSPTFKSVAEVDERAAIFNRMAVANDNLDQFLAGFEKDFSQLLALKGFSAEAIPRIAANAIESMHMPAQRKICQTNRDIVTEADIIFGLFKNNWGNWRMPSENNYEFDNPDHEHDYQAAVIRLNRAVGRQKQLRTDMIASQTQRNKNSQTTVKP